MVRLAELMYRSLGVAPAEDVWAQWRADAEASVCDGDPARFAGVVADDPDRPGRLLSCGVVTIGERLPNPLHGDRRVAYIQWMSTETSARRRGLGTAVLRGLVAWCEEQGLDNVELHASPDGAPLYRAAGFWEGSTGVAMRRRSWDPPPDGGP